MYDLIQGLAIIIYLLFFTFYGKHYNISKIKSFILGIIGMIIYLFLVKFLAWAETGFQYFGSENGIRVYVFLPIFIYGLAKLSRVKPLDLFDLQAGPCVLMYGVSHMACIFAGCCQGFQYYESTPLYNLAYRLTGTNMLPIQLWESLSALVVFAIVYIVGKIKHHRTNGRLFCLWYILFGAERFLWEFLRDNQKVIIFKEMEQTNGYLGISNLAIWSALMFITGVIIYIYIRKLEKSK